MIMAINICCHCTAVRYHDTEFWYWLYSFSLSDALEGWTQIIQLPNCLVYQKLYKETGLFQYKVIGSYYDITARDFIDVQVC